MADVCDHCNKEVDILTLCEMCHTASYCSVQCSRDAWSEHKPACLAAQDKVIEEAIAERAQMAFENLEDGIFNVHINGRPVSRLNIPRDALRSELGGLPLLFEMPKQGPAKKSMKVATGPGSTAAVRLKMKTSSIVSMAEFAERFAAMSGGAFGSWTAAHWKNVVVAGGAVLACLRSNPLSLKPTANADIDLFIYGLDDKAARNKIYELFTLVAKTTPGCQAIESKRVLAMRTPHTLTFILPLPKRHIQVVLRLHEDAEQVISCFDVDCCGVMFDGQSVFATQRAARALRTKCNVAVAERRSWTYEQRLLKYVRRGFSIAVPGLVMADVQLKKKYKITEYRKNLPKTHPMAVDSSHPKRYDRIDVGVEYRFEGDFDSWRSYRHRRDDDEEDDKPGQRDYFDATGLRKLLIAETGGGLAVFQHRYGRRSKFLPTDGSTMEIARYLMACGEHYGPGLPCVPGASKYDIAMTPIKYLTNRADPGFVNFGIGGIPTGVAEVGADPDWTADCYIFVPGVHAWNRRRHKYFPAADRRGVIALLWAFSIKSTQACGERVLHFASPEWMCPP